MSIPKKVISLQGAINEIKDIISDFDDSVVSTLGPLGKTVIISMGEGIPHVTKDGVTVSESIQYKDQLKDNVSSLLKESARKTAIEVGDGTTTSILMAIRLIEETLTYQILNVNTRAYLGGVDKAIDFVVEYLQEEIREIEMDSAELKGVINIASNNDSEITDMLIDITDQIGPHGIIDVKLVDSNVTDVLIRQGASIDSIVVAKPGDRNFETDEISNVVLIEGPVHDVHEIKDILGTIARSKIPTIIIAKEFGEAVVQAVNVNNANQSIKVILADAEGFGNSRLEILKDLSVVTGATVLSTQGATTNSLRDFITDHFGVTAGFIATKKEVIFHCLPETLELEETKKRKKDLIQEYEENTDAANVNLFKRRLAKYVKVATILVGGTTQAVAQETKDRVDDAVAAISAAVNGGVLPGGGSSLIRATKILEARKKDFKDGGEEWGRRAVMQICEAPLRTLVLNAGFDFDEDIIKSLKKNSTQSFDVIEKALVDAYDCGILDPALVLIQALTNAAAVNRSICNSNAFIVEDYETQG